MGEPQTPYHPYFNSISITNHQFWGSPILGHHHMEQADLDPVTFLLDPRGSSDDPNITDYTLRRMNMNEL